MTSRILLDSSLLVEYYKGNKTNLLISLVSDAEAELFINETVVSEFLFHLIRLNANKSPQSVQSAGNIGLELNKFSAHTFLQRFSFLPTDDTLYSLTPQFMSKYNLLPNDAIILATCKIHSITRLASHDADFIIPCKQEEIELLTETT